LIWIDITNLPHVLFFREFIRRSDCLVTTRVFGALTDLLDANGIEHVVVGRHGGAERRSKLLESTRRVEELTKLLSRFDIEVALAKHSVELPRVAYGLGIPSVFVLDNEHAEQQNRLTLPLVSSIVSPKALDRRIVFKQGADARRLNTFYGVCETRHLAGFKPDRSVVEGYGEYIVVRPEPYMAAYFRSEARTQTLIEQLASLGYRVIVLPRGGERYDHAINLEAVDSLNLLYHAKAFFGGGGTMCREAAILGVPAFSFYSQELLGVDRFLIKLGLMHHGTSLDMDLEAVIEEKGLRRKAERIRRSFEDPFKVIKKAIEEACSGR